MAQERFRSEQGSRTKHNMNKTLIHDLVSEHEFCLSQIDFYLQQWVSNNEENNSHDPGQLQMSSNCVFCYCLNGGETPTGRTYIL